MIIISDLINLYFTTYIIYLFITIYSLYNYIDINRKNINIVENIQVKPAKKLEVGIVEDLLKDPNKVVIVQTAPSVRVALGEMFGAKPGTSVTGKMVAALRQLGFKYVFDTDFGADITVWEEAMEFLKRLKGEGGPLPQFNRCCIGWLATAERTYIDLFSHISTV